MDKLHLGNKAQILNSNLESMVMNFVDKFTLRNFRISVRNHHHTYYLEDNHIFLS